MTDTVELPAVDPAQVAMLPDGVIALARQLLSRAGNTGRLDSMNLQRMLFAPLTLEPGWPAPSAPIRVTGGFVHADIVDEDRSTLDAVLDAYGQDGPEAVARAAQELRLPVSPYRRCVSEAHNDRTDRLKGPPDPTFAAGATVIDLSTHWAGPLATALLADAGAHVIKLDPACRPDGFRARPQLYSYLNGSKEIIDLDLRLDADRSRFETILTSADLIVESFSRRVMANLEYGPDRLATIAPSLRSLAIKAFPGGSPEQDWIGYGPAVHAASGLAFAKTSTGLEELQLEDLAPRPAVVAYPDFLAGLTAYTKALQLLGDTQPHRRCEVSLMASIAPLLPRPDTDEPSNGNRR